MVTTSFKIVVADPKSGQCFQREVEKKRAGAVIGLKIGDEFDAGILGLPGYKLRITGGSDEAGFPMRPGVAGPGRKRLLLASPPGYWPTGKGVRKRKTIRGATVSEDLVQINTKIVKEGKQPLEELLKGAKEKKEEEKTGA